MPTKLKSFRQIRLSDVFPVSYAPDSATIQAPTELFRAAGYQVDDAGVTAVLTVALSETLDVIDRLAVELMACHIVAEVERTNGYCDHAALRRLGWPQSRIDALGNKARALAAPRLKAVLAKAVA